MTVKTKILFQRRITYSASGSKVHPLDILIKVLYIFDVGGSAIFTSESFKDLYPIVSLVFNSKLINYLSIILNPAV
jgi:hypothetical protein